MRSCNSKGLTLIEVIAGLALMGTLLTAVLIGGSRHLRQLKMAKHKRVSVRLLEEFLAAWSANDFKADEISSAAHDSELTVTGQFGIFAPEFQDASIMPTYRVQLTRRAGPSLKESSVVRLTVSVPNSFGSRIDTAWAEVVVQDD